MSKRRKKLDLHKAVGIVRVSTKQQDIGAAAQRFALQEWCQREKVELLEVFEGRMSGATDFEKRTDLQDAIRACAKHGAGLLLAVDTDRFARDKHVFSDFERACKAIGVRPVTISGGLQEMEVLADIKQALAAEERRKISERNKRRVAQCLRPLQRACWPVPPRAVRHPSRPPLAHVELAVAPVHESFREPACAVDLVARLDLP